ncbi:cobyric acid synthase [Amycolatopsis sp. MtRt-6]|uniref:cobyric acid synthase n=1 Tax=Amycolatopsis sp. MtRt-6 TaxID=2792782 RepID=UPI001A8CB933|nr:cobyric acid synthase [Amycolatopsis sp. MtRt-6]
MTPAVLRAPRLAIADLTGAGVELAGLLTGFLRAWHIPVDVYADRDVPTPAGADPMPPEATGSLTGLATTSWRPVAANTVGLGGDVTVLLGRLSGELPRAAARTSTPLILAVAEGQARSQVEAALAADVDWAGVLVGPGAGAAEDPGELATWLADRGLKYLGRLNEVPAERASMDADAWDEAGRSVDVDALLLTANAAPHLVAEVPGGPAAVPAGGGRPKLRGSRPGRVLMVAGTHSSAGKSFLVAALARHFADRGLRVAPFKGQNMSNNARVVDGGEIGVAQYVQALAADARPDVRMNPVLLKPQAQGSAVIVNGKPAPELTALPWRIRKPLLWPLVRDALTDLRAEYDLVIVEGAGSPADMYLYHNDIVNMRIARYAAAPTVLVTDAGRGGATSHCYGSWLMLPPAERELLGGWIFNLFYRNGNPALMQPGIDHLVRLTGVPSLGMLPELDHRLPDEDLHSGAGTARGAGRTIAVVRYPQISNFDEFTVLQDLPGVRLVWARDAAAVRTADLVVLPGSRDVPADLGWMRDRGVDRAIVDAAADGRPILGICGGLQMLGQDVVDPFGIEGAAAGLDLLPLRTTLRPEKVQVRTGTRFADTVPAGDWAEVAGLPVTGYEIRHGRTERTGPVAEVLPDGRGFAAGNILAVYVHGLFENPGVVQALFGVATDYRVELERSVDVVVAALREHLDMAAIEALVT